MTEPESEIIDFYPERFHIDMNGKKMIWQGVALLPFIERDRLLAALEPRYARLDPFETRRNTRGSEVMFVNDENPLYDSLIQLYMGKKGDEVRVCGCLREESRN
jgi:5'-3' exoribonuclease 2